MTRGLLRQGKGVRRSEADAGREVTRKACPARTFLAEVWDLVALDFIAEVRRGFGREAEAEEDEDALLLAFSWAAAHRLGGRGDGRNAAWLALERPVRWRRSPLGFDRVEVRQRHGRSGQKAVPDRRFLF